MMTAFSDVFADVTKQGTKLQTSEYLASGKYPIIDQGQDDIAGYTDRENGLFTDVPAIIFGDHTRIVKYVDMPFFLGADGVKVLKATIPDVDCRYLYYAVSAVKIPNTGYNRHFKWLKEAQIPLPDISTQRRIADTLDKVSEGIEVCRKMLGELDLMVKAKFGEMFGNMETNPMGWKKSTIGQECFYIKDGPHKSPPYVDEGIPFISTRNIVNGDGIDWSTAKHISEADYIECIKKCKPEKGDILYSKGGTTGIAKLVETDQRFANWVHVAVLKFGNQLDGKFFECMLNMEYCYQQSQRLTKGIANRDFVLSAIAQVKIIVPPIDAQKRYTEFVTKVAKSKLTIQRILDKMETEKLALMQKYFA